MIVLPGGFETFFRTCAEVFASAAGGPPDLGRIGAAAAEHGIEIVGPPLAAAGLRIVRPQLSSSCLTPGWRLGGIVRASPNGRWRGRFPSALHARCR